MSAGSTKRSMSRLLPGTLASRLTAVYALTFVALLGLAFLILYASVRTVFDYRLDGDLAEDAEWLATALAREGDAAGMRVIRREAETDDERELFIVLGTRDGSVLYSTNLDSWPGAHIDATVAARALETDELQYQTEEFEGRDSAARTVMARVGENRIAYLAESLEERDEVMEMLLASFVMVFVLAVPLASLFVWLLSRRTVEGIAAVSRTASAIRAGALERRAPVDDSVDEVRSLACSFNAMADRNQKLIDDMREMTDNIAHDLRSPLTRVRIIAESALHGSPDPRGQLAAAEDIVQECDRLTRMIDVALDVSEAEAGISRLTPVRVDLGQTVIGVVDLFDAVSEEQGIELVCDVQEGLVVDGDRTALERLLVNLVDNAIKFTPPHGAIRVSARRTSDTVTLEVFDNGAGIPAAALPRVFDRYYRADASRTTAGSGLGLSYARAVARLHGGDIDVRSEPGVSTCFTVRLSAGEPDIVRDKHSAPKRATRLATG